MGHQFGGNHTFNGSQYNCGGNKAAPSVEPGSGSSVMAYAGICQQDNLQPHTDPYFSQWTQQEVTAYITSDRSPINEVQNVSLVGFDGTDAFTLSYGGQATAPIVRGTTYTTAGIKAALEAILPAGGNVTVAAFAGSGQLTDFGFQLTFNSLGGNPAPPPSPLAGIDLESVTVTPSAGTFTGFTGETAKGGPIQNAGYTVETTANHTPVVTTTPQVSIPLRTPFSLTGSATDADGDNLIYLWEQTDRGGTGTGTALVSQTKANGPLFRVFGTYANVTPAGTLLIDSPGENLADGNPTRTFPDMEQILIGNTNAETGLCPTAPAPPATGGATNVPVPTIDCFSEWMPTADYVGAAPAGNDTPLSLNFRLTARDQDPIAGGYAFANTKVLIDNTAGPFLVSSKNVAAAATAGRSEVVTWAVAGTNTPALAENVKISLSTDGGRTFPIVLAESTPNDGTQPVTWPNVATDHARIKIEAVGNVFFDVNNADFQIVPRLLLSEQVAGPVMAATGNALKSVTVVTAESGAGDATALTASATGLPAGLALSSEVLSAAGAVPGKVRWTLTGTPTSAPGTYPVTVTVTDGSTAPQQVTFDVVLSAAPETTISSGPADGSIWLEPTATFAATSSVPGSTFVCTLDGVPTGCGALTGLGAGTHVFGVSAVDAAGVVDPTPAIRTFTVPLDDRALNRQGYWKRKKAKAAFAGTYTQASSRGEVLTHRVDRATSIALLVRKAPGSGTVKVSLAGKSTRVSLKGKAGWKVVPLGLTGSGTVTITTLGKKKVIVDGLAVVTQP